MFNYFLYILWILWMSFVACFVQLLIKTIKTFLDVTTENNAKIQNAKEKTQKTKGFNGLTLWKVVTPNDFSIPFATG